MFFTSTPERLKIKKSLVKKLNEVSIGGTITHQEIHKIMGDINSPDSIKYAALKQLQKEGVLFSSVRGIGYKRLEAKEIPSVGSNARKSIRRKARKTKNAIAQSLGRNSNSMTEKEKKASYTEIASLGLIEISAGEVGKKNAEVQVANIQSEANTSLELVKRLTDS